MTIFKHPRNGKKLSSGFFAIVVIAKYHLKVFTSRQFSSMVKIRILEEMTDLQTLH